MLELASRLASQAAAIALPRVRERPTQRKADSTDVTDVDRDVQAFVLTEIARQYPDHAVIAEETSADGSSRRGAGNARYCWVVDPLDGTRNFIVGFPCFSTSIAVLDGSRPVASAICEHNLGRLYTARLGGGAFVDGKPAAAYEPPPHEDWLVGGPANKDAISVRVLQHLVATRGLIYRNLGSSAAHLAWVASGALTAAFARKCKIWDIAAGILLVREAGGVVTGLSGEELRLDLAAPPELDIPFLAGHPRSHARLLEMFRPLVAP